MGSIWSGRRYRRNTRALVDDRDSLSVLALYRAGLFETATPFLWEGLIGRAYGDCVTFWNSDGQGEPEVTGGSLILPVEWTEPNFGGLRPWLLCPGHECGRRVVFLFWNAGAFRCRRCLNLAYSSQNADGIARASRRARKIRQRLGGTADLMQPLPGRPKGMHRRTYLRLLLAAARQERDYAARLGGYITAIEEAR